MVYINCTLFNFLHQDELLSTFLGMQTTLNILPMVSSEGRAPFLPRMWSQDDLNGYNTYTKKGLDSEDRLLRHESPETP